MDLPLFEMTLKAENDGVNAVALVAKPAVKRAVQLFENVAPRNVNLSLSVTDGKKGIISGLLMLADTPIYRKDNELGEYYAYASKETLFEAAKKFISEGYAKNIKFTHQAAEPEEGAIVFEIFQCDKERGIHPMKGFEDATDGSLFISADISKCPKLMAAIESGELTGYSLEGLFTMMPKDKGVEDEILQELNEMQNYLQSIINRNGNK